MFDLLQKIIGNPNERKVKKLEPIVDHINDLEATISKLSDEELRGKTYQFRQELDNRERSDNPKRDRQLEEEVLELLLPEAFAVTREAGKRVLGMRHFDVQLMGGMVLHKGGIAEMRTGEGKTLVATLPAYLNALSGKGVHIVTVNDYLAQRDAEWMGKLYEFLGLSVGKVLSYKRGGFNVFAEKKHAYGCDLTYGTNNEFGFDYLRDNMASSLSQVCQRPYHYAVVDEVDSILIDEARTPLIISGRLEQSSETYQAMARVSPLLDRDKDYTVDEKARNVVLTEEGIDRAQELVEVEDLFDPKTNLAHHLLQALKAKELFKRDIDYVVKNDECVIVDEFTGRLMEGRRWGDGLHQAVEAKEGVRIKDETQTLASITFQNLFRLYPKLAGMTGTAMTEEAEFGKIYNLEVTTMPTNRHDVRIDHPDVIYKTEKVKFYKVIEEIVEQYQKGRPVLVGTVSIEKSEWISHLLSHPEELTKHLEEKAARLAKTLPDFNDTELDKSLQPLLVQPASHSAEKIAQATEGLTKHSELTDFVRGLAKTKRAIEAIQQGIPHHVLNAKYHEQEAMIVAQAGRHGAVTIATNMAGRGTDIVLGGNPEFLAKQALAEADLDWRTVPTEHLESVVREKQTITESEKQKVVAAGGLHIIGTERHESRRIDNQLRGRAARQGDPGSTSFYLSLEDPLMRLFGGQKIAGLMEMLNVDETLPITAGLVTRAIEGAQRKVEAYHFDLRKNILQYDDVLTEQRKLIYEQRRRVLSGDNLRESIVHMVEQEMGRVVTAHLTADASPEEWDEEALQELITQFQGLVPQLSHIGPTDIRGKAYPQLIEFLQKEGVAVYERMEFELAQFAKELEENHGIQISGLEEVSSSERSEIQSTEQQHPMRRIERDILLSVVDSKWIDYLHNLDALREGIGLRAYGQKDPLIEYKREAFEMFQQLTYDIQRETVALLFRARIEVQLEQHQEEAPLLQEGIEVFDSPIQEALEQATYQEVELSPGVSDKEEGLPVGVAATLSMKPDPNEDCPCGSGKKYRRCHGV